MTTLSTPPTSYAAQAAPKILRIVRLRVVDQPGFLGRIATVLGELKANIGEISIAAQGPDYILRDISLQLIDETHLARVLEALEQLEGVRVESVADPVQRIHEGGKVGMRSRIKLDSLEAMRKIYTPGVAQICKIIQEEPGKSRLFTAIPNTVAIVTNGTAILGLGNIGVLAGMPVMEGKSVIFDQTVGLSAIPILVESADPAVVIETVTRIAATFGAIQLEDIAAPECFEIETELQKRLSIPVLHDDQHGTAVVVLGALLTISNRLSVKLRDCKIGVIGLGAAGTAIARLLLSFGVKEILGTDLKQDAMLRLKQSGGYPTDLESVMGGAEIVLATTGVPGLIKPEMIRHGQVILALSNPDPEIRPEVAKSSGARFAADGRTINNALAFPGLFKGALAVGATCFTDEMKIAAAVAIAGQTKADNLAPSILDLEVHTAVAQAVSKAWEKRSS
jgi:malate dehydrogenase (oxaloacetate-decarboxylating)